MGAAIVGQLAALTYLLKETSAYHLMDTYDIRGDTALHLVSLCTYIHTYIQACMHIYPPTYLPTFMHTYIHTYFPACMHTYIPTYQPIHLPTYLQACQYGHASAVAILLQIGADPSRINRRGMTPLGKSFQHAHHGCFRLVQVGGLVGK